MCYNDFSSMPLLLSVTDLADTLRISKHSAYSLARSGQIRILRVGQMIRIPRESFVEYLKENAKSV